MQVRASLNSICTIPRKSMQICAKYQSWNEKLQTIKPASLLENCRIDHFGKSNVGDTVADSGAQQQYYSGLGNDSMGKGVSLRRRIIINRIFIYRNGLFIRGDEWQRRTAIVTETITEQYDARIQCFRLSRGLQKQFDAPSSFEYVLSYTLQHPSLTTRRLHLS